MEVFTQTARSQRLPRRTGRRKGRASRTAGSRSAGKSSASQVAARKSSHSAGFPDLRRRCRMRKHHAHYLKRYVTPLTRSLPKSPENAKRSTCKTTVCTVTRIRILHACGPPVGRGDDAQARLQELQHRALRRGLLRLHAPHVLPGQRVRPDLAEAADWTEPGTQNLLKQLRTSSGYRKL